MTDAYSTNVDSSKSLTQKSDAVPDAIDESTSRRQGRFRQSLSCTNAENLPVKSSSKMHRASFRLPGAKKHRKDRSENQSGSVSHVRLNQVQEASLEQCDVNSGRKATKDKKRRKKDFVGLGLLSKDHRKSHEKKSKHDRKSNTTMVHSPHTPVFGTPLELAVERNPSHDGVPLPAFFRHCIDYIEMFGLCSEGIYRVPGVNSQVQSLIASIDQGEEFPLIAPTSPAFHHHHQSPPPFKGSEQKPLVISPSRFVRTIGDSRSNRTTVSLAAVGHLPHDIAVIASVVKHFLRNLPEPVLTNALRPVMESVPSESPQVYHSLARVVHRELPVYNRFLLAWLLQHMTHIIDRCGENLMTVANLSIVLSPCLRISHRLLGILLDPAPIDLCINLSEIDPSLSPVETNLTNLDPSTWHWLFPHPTYQMRPYRPPLKPMPDLELPEDEVELNVELGKQQSLLAHLHKLIERGQVTSGTEATLWETQHLVTEIKRRKSLCDPELIRQELARQQAKLDRLQQAVVDAEEQRRSQSCEKSNKHRPTPNLVHPDEFLTVQNQVTMLKRRLRQLEKLATRSASPPSALPIGNIVMSGSIPLVIPTLAELDQEEVLNLTLRRLPLDAPSIPAAKESVVPTQMPLPDVKLARPPSTSLPMADVDVERRSSPNSPRSIRISSTPVLVEGTFSSVKKVVDQQETSDGLSVDAKGAPGQEHLEQSSEIPDHQKVSIAVDAHSPPSSIRGLTNIQEPPEDCAQQCGDDHFPYENPNAELTSDKPGTDPTPVPSVPLEQPLLQRIALYSARKQELEAIRTDLRSRILSENAEINRIQSYISDLLEAGDERSRHIYDSQFRSSHLRSSVACRQPTALWHEKPWAQMVEHLNGSDYDPDEKEASYLMDNSEGSDRFGDYDDDDSEATESGGSHVMAYSRLDDEDEDDEMNKDSTIDCPFVKPKSPSTDSHKDADSEVCEAELARSLYQLILDNARLEQLNSRYFDGIQAERNRCAELKVLLKLKSSRALSSTASNSSSRTSQLSAML